MSLIQFDIRYPNGQREAIVVEGQRALIGSGSHCDVRLPMDQAAYEHVRVESIGNTLRAEAVAEQPLATINGMPLTQSPLAADSVLGIGNVRIFVGHVSDIMEGAQLSAAKSKQSTPMVRVALVVGFAAAAYMLLAETESEIAPPPAEAPKLFSESAATCPQANPVQAVALGQEQLDIADGKRERMPFFVTDGVTAVGLYQVASACFKVGGVKSQEDEASRRRCRTTSARARCGSPTRSRSVTTHSPSRT
jgi:hypothetical protein